MFEPLATGIILCEIDRHLTGMAFGDNPYIFLDNISVCMHNLKNKTKNPPPAKKNHDDLIDRTGGINSQPEARTILSFDYSFSV